MSSPQSLLGLTAAGARDSTTAAQRRVGYRVHADFPWFVLPIGVQSQVALDAVLAPLPNVQRWFTGVLNLRGNLVPVFDIAGACGMPLADVKRSTVLVLQPNQQPFGVLCVEMPQVGTGVPVAATELPIQMQSLRPFLQSPLQLPFGLGHEFLFRAWIAWASRNRTAEPFLTGENQP